MVLAHPGSSEGRQRQSKQQVQVRPQDAPCDLLSRMQKAMMVVLF
jgi:hypothetical protein